MEDKPINAEVISLQFTNLHEKITALTEGDIKDIKKTLKDILDSTPSRREFDELKDNMKTKADQKDLVMLQKMIYGAYGAILLELLRVLSNYFVKPQ